MQKLPSRRREATLHGIQPNDAALCPTSAENRIISLHFPTGFFMGFPRGRCLAMCDVPAGVFLPGVVGSYINHREAPTVL